MVILNIETSTDACSCALTEDGKLLHNAEGSAYAFITPAHSEHAKELALMAEDLVASAHVAGLSIGAVAVSAGPGSYTGLRIGASTAKGIAYGMNVPLLAIPTLQLMAAAAAAKGAEGLLCPMIDARRMEVYDALYDANLQELRPAEATVVNEESFLDILADNVVTFFGNGAPKCKAVITHPNARFLDEIVPDAAYMGALAQATYDRKDFADVAYWTPFYLKEFEAKVSTVKGLN